MGGLDIYLLFNCNRNFKNHHSHTNTRLSCFVDLFQPPLPPKTMLNMMVKIQKKKKQIQIAQYSYQK